MSDTLLPCPFCGGNPILKDFGIGRGGYMISCSNRCGVMMTAQGKNGNINRDKEIHEEIRIAVINAWNKRLKPLSEESQRIKDLQNIIEHYVETCKNYDKAITNYEAQLKMNEPIKDTRSLAIPQEDLDYFKKKWGNR